MEQNNEQISSELKDIVENIRRYCVTNKGEVCFVYGFITFEKDPEHKCIDCGEDCERVKESASRIGAFGHLWNLRELLNGLRDDIEDAMDENGFVNI